MGWTGEATPSSFQTGHGQGYPSFILKGWAGDATLPFERGRQTRLPFLPFERGGHARLPFLLNMTDIKVTFPSFGMGQMGDATGTIYFKRG